MDLREQNLNYINKHLAEFSDNKIYINHETQMITEVYYKHKDRFGGEYMKSNEISFHALKEVFEENTRAEDFWYDLGERSVYGTITDIAAPQFITEAEKFLEKPCDYKGRGEDTVNALRELVSSVRDMPEDKNMIRFIDTNYNELFRIPDGGYIVVTRPDGEEYIAECSYLDETHLRVNGNCYHICQFAEIQERNGATVKPDTEPEINCGYRIIQRNYVRDKVIKLGVNPNAAQKYVTWQSYHDNPTSYDWGHYWNDKSIAKTDLFLRTDSIRTGKYYDYTTLIKQQKNRDDAR